jgi:hypothetical protein
MLSHSAKLVTKEMMGVIFNYTGWYKNYPRRYCHLIGIPAAA